MVKHKLKKFKINGLYHVLVNPLFHTKVNAQKMKEYGNICELHLYEGEEHGFFNYGRNSGVAFKDTMEKSYNFLKKLKFIK